MSPGKKKYVSMKIDGRKKTQTEATVTCPPERSSSGIFKNKTNDWFLQILSILSKVLYCSEQFF